MSRSSEDDATERPFGFSEAQIRKITRLSHKQQALLSGSSLTSQPKASDLRSLRIASAMASFLSPEMLRGKRILELGPGHYAFACLARELGASVVCIENDPSLVALGESLGFDVIHTDFYQLPRSWAELSAYDGLWVKGTFNACRLSESTEVWGLSTALTTCLREAGWGVVIPVNKGTSASGTSSHIKERIATQRYAFETLGWQAIAPSLEFRRLRAMNYSGSPWIFLRNIPAQTTESFPVSDQEGI